MNVCAQSTSHVWLCSSWIVARQALLYMGILQARILEWVAILSSRGPSQPEIEPRSPTLQVDSLPSEPPGKPKNNGVGSLSLLQANFLTQELNQGLLHCRQIPYQLSYPGSPKQGYWLKKTRAVKTYSLPNPWNSWILLYMLKGVVTLTVLKGDAYPGLSRWALSVFTHILLREGLRRPETHRGRRQCGDGGWDWSDVTTSQGGLAPPDHQQGALSHSVSGPSRGCGPGVPGFRLLLPDPRENKFLSLASIFVVFCCSGNRNLIPWDSG